MISLQDSKRSERPENCEQCAAIFWEVAMDGSLANVDGVEGADTKSATGTPSPALAIKSLRNQGFFYLTAINMNSIISGLEAE